MGDGTLARGTERFLVAMGSNIDPADHLDQAVRRLSGLFPVVSVSSAYESKPKGDRGGPLFLNAALLLESPAPARALKFDVLRPIERELGRVRTANRNAPRTIDLDLALYGEWVLAEDDLRIPDPALLTEPHVAVPAAEIAPGTVHPVDGRSLAQIASELELPRGFRRSHRYDFEARRFLPLGEPDQSTGAGPGKQRGFPDVG